MDPLRGEYYHNFSLQFDTSGKASLRTCLWELCLYAKEDLWTTETLNSLKHFIGRCKVIVYNWILSLNVKTTNSASTSVAELPSLHCEVWLVVFPRSRLFRTHASAEKTITCFSALQVILTTEETALFEIKNIKEDK